MPTPTSVAALIKRMPSVARIPQRSLISISGAQAPEFLNGLLSTTVGNAPRAPFFSSFLHAQGRVLYDVFVYTTYDPKHQSAYVLEYDSLAASVGAPDLLAYLKRHVLRSKVRVRDVTQEHDIWAAWHGEGTPHQDRPLKWDLARSGVIEPIWDQASWPWGSENELIRDRRAPGMGLRRLVRKDDRPQEAGTHDEVSAEEYSFHRIIHGVPEGSSDIPPMHAFPMDSNLDIMSGLDFRKGCYVGQELTVRTYHTGVIRKRIFPVIIHPPPHLHTCHSQPHHHLLLHRIPSLASNNQDFSPGVDIRASLTHPPPEGRLVRPRGSGKLLSTAKGVGLALLRLEHVQGLMKGDIKFEVAGTKGESAEAGEGESWHVTPWWPNPETEAAVFEKQDQS
ncbi:hypothetical protein HETIRDRAFT_314149 [Heterobasidion irregulare TC 32-1]|uniref:CAF17 C-terminal domain-containing protein n=1 Tax=Heterobasidion irregulare (strain TC 32-1) TaxID=747525 RepID=W4KH48_HETIT|nr:uncharacterized protein HETIRDRAFT_314149 [Heterobasidion irregulare TC 32-1]ETW84361.1 hypothetical protein HETIRDRAFT_314149 [Heterobasidion irregulare TC 32-1]